MQMISNTLVRKAESEVITRMQDRPGRGHDFCVCPLSTGDEGVALLSHYTVGQQRPDLPQNR